LAPWRSMWVSDSGANQRVDTIKLHCAGFDCSIRARPLWPCHRGQAEALGEVLREVLVHPMPRTSINYFYTCTLPKKWA
jgi:hypothetical protein